MSNIPDEFEPDRLYDKWEAERAKELKYLQTHIKCKDCNESMLPDNDFEDCRGKIGWCLVHQMFVDPDEYAIYYDCEDVNVY